jgi:transformation/transcription domain-associated protein
MAVIEASLKKVAEMLAGSAYLSQKFKASFEADFLSSSSSSSCENGLTGVLDKLLRWKQHLGTVLDKLPCKFHLENFSRYLAEFEHQRYDEIEVPGQYLALRDASSEFVKLDRFESQVEIVKRHGTAFRRIVMCGSDGSKTAFIIQNPTSRQSRREERMVQMMRMADAIVDKKIISRRHGLGFHVQNIVPLSAFVRLIEDPQAFCSLEDVYEWHCKQVGMRPEDPVLYFRDSMYKGIESLQIPFKKGSVDLLNLRVDLFEEVAHKFVPNDCLSRFVQAEHRDACAYWNFRRRFTAQYASFTFISYALAIGHRFPHKIGFSRDAVDLIGYELLPALNASGQLTLTEAVPFRLTPNLQHFLTEVGIEGPFASYLMALGQALSGKKQDLADYLSLYVRDELLAWLASPAGAALATSMLPGAAGANDDSAAIINMQSELAAKIIQNVEIVMKRVQSMACHRESEKGAEVTQPLDQTVLDLISCAVNPQKLAHMDSHWHPWF